MNRVDGSNADKYDVSVLLQEGVYVERAGASSVMRFICDLLGVSPDTVQKDVKTVMMDNKVVDDSTTESMQKASTLVLCGAMPGLVGAMLRSDSPYKAMRSTITSGTGAGTIPAAPLIQVKLFNTVLKKYAEAVIRHGFWVESDGEA